MGDGLPPSGQGPAFAVLGPLEVTLEGATTVVRGARRRALLARLLVSANQVVSSDTLIDDLWPDDPPDNPTNALQAYLSHLRSALGAGRSGGRRDATILTRRPGYLLSVSPDRLDALRFEHLAAEGRTALCEDRPEVAAGTLRRGLALWRGRALAEFGDEAWARPTAARLDELRWAALEDRIEADLALGRHGALVGEIEAALARQPLRERLHGQLMLALYRAGRQADALRAYQQVRASLREELGIEPGRTLRQLEEAVLVQKPELDWAPSEGRAQAATAPSRPLPDGGMPIPSAPAVPPGGRRVSSPSFVGRTAELARLRSALGRVGRGEPAAVVVGGEAGVGKTRLVNEVATAAAGRGAAVLVGRGIEGSGLPYGPVVQALRSLTADLDGPALEAVLGPGRVELDRLLPDIEPPARALPLDHAPDSTRARMLDSLVGLLGRLARSSPLVLVVEDVHWADPSTLDLLVFLVRSLRREAVLLLVTYRSDDARSSMVLRPLLAELCRSPLVERLELGRFSRERSSPSSRASSGVRPRRRWPTPSGRARGGTPSSPRSY